MRQIIGIGQIKVIPGDPGANGMEILRLIEKASSAGLTLLCLPEMALPGYLLGDAWERPDFLRECEVWNQKIIGATAGGIAVAFGTVCVDWDLRGEDGRPRKYNAAILAQDGEALLNPGLNRDYFIKTLLPNYREFEDSRHFFDSRKWAQEKNKVLEDLIDPVELKTKGGPIRLGVTICEDGWSEHYGLHPFAILKIKGAELLLNLSCSPYTSKKNTRRNVLFSQLAVKHGVPIAYVNNVGLQNNGKTLFTFDGASAVYDKTGAAILRCAPYAEELKSFMWPLSDSTTVSPLRNAKENPAEDHYEALTYGARAYLDQCGVDKIVIGISGGIDSAVAAALYRRVLPPENILLVNMPSRHNSATTKNLSRQLAENLQCLYAEIGIEESVALTEKQIHDLRVDSPDGTRSLKLSLSAFHFENIQARDRSSRILAALSSAFGGVFNCNANKAEMTVGYSTLYGDLSGFLALIGDLWKSEVYGLGRYLNEKVFEREVIPWDIFDLKPSAELSPEQDVEKGQGDPLYYPYHDKLFHSWIQKWDRTTPADILQWYDDGTLLKNLNCPEVPLDMLFPTPRRFVQDLEHWWDLYCGMGVAKRVQAPPVLAVSSRAFGFDHRETLGRPFYSTAYKELKSKILG